MLKSIHPNPMHNHHPLISWLTSLFGFGGTYYLGKVATGSNWGLTFFTVITGTVTTIYTILKIVQWFHWWKNRKTQKPPL